MQTPPIMLVTSPPTVRVENGLVILEREDYWRAMPPHVAEATARAVLKALEEWREAESAKVVPFA